MSAIAELRTQGILARDACDALSMPRSTYYRKQRPKVSGKAGAPRPTPPRALPPGDRQAVLDVLHSERFVHRSPAQVWATLLDVDKAYMYSRKSSASAPVQRRAQRR